MIDSHFHIWQLARGDYGWLTPALAPIYRDVAVADWLIHADAGGVNHGILVQAAPSAAETDFLLQQAVLYPARIPGVVGWTDLAAPDAADRIAALAAHPALLGLRPMLQDISDPGWILQPAVLAALATLPRHGLAFDALVKPLHLDSIEKLATTLPDLSIIIDHGAKPHIGGSGFASWAAALQRLAAFKNVYCKLSGLLTESGPAPSLAACQPYMEHILATFPGRTLWGSDWPVLELAGQYPAWLSYCQALVAERGADSGAVFGGAARRAYGLTS